MSYIDSEQNFYGRRDVLQQLKKRVVNLKEGYRQNISFVGNRYVGKTSVLQEFLHNLDDSKVTPLYFDLENKDIFYFFHKFSASLLYHYLKNNQLPLHDDLNLLIEEAGRYIPQTVEVIKNIQLSLGKGKIETSFLGLMTLPEIYTNESDQFCVLILDEFQEMEGFCIDDLYTNLSKKIMTQKKCLYILSSSYKSCAQKIISEELSLLFGNFEQVELEPFGYKNSHDFVEGFLQDQSISRHLTNFLTDFTGGYPLYLHLICRELLSLKALYKQDEIYMPLVSQSVENTLFDRWGVISRHFELIINELCHIKGNRITSGILIALSNGLQKSEDILDELDVKKSVLTQKLNKLQDEGIIKKNGKLHYFKDKLFKYWIKYVYQKRLNEIELTPDNQRKQFRDEFINYVDHFKFTSRKDFPSRIVELLNCFDNEALSLNGRKYRLPMFRDITSSRMQDEIGANIDVIKASTENSTWLILVKKDSFQECDISTIVGEAKKLERKPEKCLMISMSELDDHIRLKALQERFWIWNEEELNILLNLFDKPYIVR